MKKKMTKDVVPEGFSMSMVLADLVPVVFFGATALVIGMILHSTWISIGAAMTFVSGFVKVIWKLIVVLKKKNIWPLFLQMRIVMPIGFVIFLISLILRLCAIPLGIIGAALTGMPQLLFFGMGIAGMLAMVGFAKTLDSSDAKANWIEQTTNGISQACFFMGVLLIYLREL